MALEGSIIQADLHHSSQPGAVALKKRFGRNHVPLRRPDEAIRRYRPHHHFENLYL